MLNDLQHKSAELSFGFKMVDVWYKNLHRTVQSDKETFETFRDLEQDIKGINAGNRGEWKHKHCQRSCLSTVKQWGGLFPVSDNDTQTIYVNKVCAICNDVISITSWKMSIFCSEEIEDMYYLDILNGLVNNVNLPKYCNLLFTPHYSPYSAHAYDLALIFKENNFRCPYMSVMERCLYKNNFDIPVGVTLNKFEIRRQCEEESAYHRRYQQHNRLFINPMCLICNRLYHQHMTFTEEIPKTPGGKSFGYSSLLQMNVWLQVDESDKYRNTISLSEVCDKHNEVNLYCFRTQACQARNTVKSAYKKPAYRKLAVIKNCFSFPVAMHLKGIPAIRNTFYGPDELHLSFNLNNFVF